MIIGLCFLMIATSLGLCSSGRNLYLTGTTMAIAIVNKWCKTNKGTITGAILAANGIGGAIAVQIISPIIFQEGNPFGYRTSYHMVSIVFSVVLLLIISIVFIWQFSVCFSQAWHFRD